MSDNSENSDFMSGDDFRSRRKRIGLTQQALADILECSRQHIVNIENGTRVPVVYAYAMTALYQEKLTQYAAA